MKSGDKHKEIMWGVFCGGEIEPTGWAHEQSTEHGEFKCVRCGKQWGMKKRSGPPDPPTGRAGGWWNSTWTYKKKIYGGK